MLPRVRKLCLSLGLCVGGSVLAAPPRVCELAGTRLGLAQAATIVETDEEGNGQLNVDFDHDGLKDELKWSITGSASIIPADNSTSTLTLTSTGKSFNLEQARLHVIKFESRYYLITGWVESGQGPWHKEVFALTRRGYVKICAFSGKGLSQ